MRGTLVLEDGKCFEGQVFGRGLPQRCEVVSVAGVPWHDLLTSPAYTGQIVVATDAPASPPVSVAGAGCGAAGTADAATLPDVGETTYPSGLLLNGVPATEADAAAWRAGFGGLSGVDTRALAAHLRRTGPMSGTLVMGPVGPDAVPPTSKSTTGRSAADIAKEPQQVSTSRPYRIYGGGDKVVLYDYGVSSDLLHWLSASDCHTTVVPWDYPAESVEEMLPDLVILSGGPGNPAAHDEIIAAFRPLLGIVPLLGVGLGHQLLARSQGARTGSMWCGHRSHDVAVRELDTGRIVSTWQSHGYTVLGAPACARATHVAVDDGSIEGLIYPGLGAASVQFTPGPFARDSAMGPVWRLATGRLLQTGAAAALSAAGAADRLRVAL